jgi:transcriptional regulator with XRE-family HTH domain
MEKVIQKIHLIQKQNCISNEYISSQLEISIRDYNKLLSGKSEIKLSKLNKIASILRVDLQDFFL